MEFKAGMEKVDISSINTMLQDFSKGTHFQEKLSREQERDREYINQMLKKMDTIPKDDVEYESSVNGYLDSLVLQRDLSHMFIHVDMDAFYAGVEEMDFPHLRGTPVAVGSMDMLVTSNYIARKFGVRSGLPGLLAMQLCPHLNIQPSRMDRYREVSSVIRNVLSQFDENYVSPSLDEGSVDITEYLIRNPTLTPLDVAQQLQFEIYKQTTLTSSMGIACSPLLAKLCSEVNKPNGYFYLENNLDTCSTFINSIPVKKIPGIGKVRQKLLETLGLEKIEDIMEFKYDLYHLLPSHRDILFKHALTIPIFPSASSYRRQKKRTMISKEKNCKELYDQQDLNDLMQKLFESAISILKDDKRLALGLIVKIQDYHFITNNHTFTLTKGLPEPKVYEDDIYSKQISSNNNNNLNDSFSSDNFDSSSSSSSYSPPSSPIQGNNNNYNNSPSKKLKSPTSKLSYYKNNPPFTIEENCVKIWNLFSQTAKSVKFESIRCLGLKLVNLIDDNNFYNNGSSVNNNCDIGNDGEY
eukprot:gene1930-2365_t